jgi:hypothetical protein
MRSQRFAPAAAASSVADVCRATAGLQAQSWPAAVLAVRPRSHGLTEADVDRARVESRDVIRSWFMRGTLHLVPTEDVGWLLGLVGPAEIAASRKRRLDLGLDDETSALGIRTLEAVLADGPRSRAEIEQELVARAVPIRPKTQALIHLIRLAALEGRVCYGPPIGRGREQSFVLLRDWADVGKPLESEAAAVQLARRYLAAFAPAGIRDFAKWSGLPMPLVRRAFATVTPEFVEVTALGETAFVARETLDALPELAASEPLVRLTGAFDTYLIGYVERGGIVEEQRLYGHVWYGGLIAPVVLVDGAFAATWKPERTAREVVVRVSPSGELDALLPALEAEAADLGRFLGLSARLVIEQ